MPEPKEISNKGIDAITNISGQFKEGPSPANILRFGAIVIIGIIVIFTIGAVTKSEIMGVIIILSLFSAIAMGIYFFYPGYVQSAQQQKAMQHSAVFKEFKS